LSYKNLDAMIGLISPKFHKYIVGVITLTKKRSIPPLKKGKKISNELRKPLDTPKTWP